MIESANKPANLIGKSANKSVDSDGKSADNTEDLTQRQEQINILRKLLLLRSDKKIQEPDS